MSDWIEVLIAFIENVSTAKKSEAGPWRVFSTVLAALIGLSVLALAAEIVWLFLKALIGV